MTDLFIELSLVFVGFLFTIFLLRYLLTSDKKEKKVFVAEDGTEFDNEKLCTEYNVVYKRLIRLYQDDSDIKTRKKKEVLGMKSLFLSKLKDEGFSDIKTLFTYKDDFKTLSDLLHYQEPQDGETLNS